MKVELEGGRVCYVKFTVKHRRNGRHTTYCTVRVQQEGEPERGAVFEAKCSPRDWYNKVMGKARAMDRALRSLDLSRSDRLRVWERFYRHFEQSPDCLALSR
jgi:hypothetical protein